MGARIEVKDKAEIGTVKIKVLIFVVKGINVNVNFRTDEEIYVFVVLHDVNFNSSYIHKKSKKVELLNIIVFQTIFRMNTSETLVKH